VPLADNPDRNGVAARIGRRMWIRPTPCKIHVPPQCASCGRKPPDPGQQTHGRRCPIPWETFAATGHLPMRATAIRIPRHHPPAAHVALMRVLSGRCGMKCQRIPTILTPAVTSFRILQWCLTEARAFGHGPSSPRSCWPRFEARGANSRPSRSVSKITREVCSCALKGPSSGPYRRQSLDSQRISKQDRRHEDRHADRFARVIFS